MSEGVIILGAGGHAKVIADIILTRGEKLIGFLDDNASNDILGYPVLGRICDINKYADNHTFVIGIGNNHVRKSISEKYSVNWYTAIHPDAIVARNVEICDGSVVMARTVINPSTRIGRHCIINTAVVVEHDNIIDDYVHISPNATLCGTVHIGELTHIGAGATVKNNVSICGNCIIGAGAVAVKDILEKGVYVGMPAGLLK